MAENKTQPTNASVTAFIDAIPDPVKRADSKTLIKMMRQATGEKPKMWGPSIIGFGTYHYVYESGREGDMGLAGFSPRKSAIVVYIATGTRAAKALLDKLGKHSTGKVCLYIKRLADVDLAILEQLIVQSVADLRARVPLAKAEKPDASRKSSSTGAAPRRKVAGNARA